jgi:predicted DNA-binding transcriptional regulator YafY
MPMRADRLLSIMLLLQVHRRLTARTLAQRLGVSGRTIHRDMEALSAAGVPVYAERGAGGGWALTEEYRTDLTGLGEGEVRALFLARSSRLLTDLGLDRAAEAALAKLLAALPAAHRREAEDARQRLLVEPSGWERPDEAVPTLPTLQAAVWRDRKLRFTYARADGAAVERLVDPLGLVAKGRVWYLVAAVDDGEARTYRVSRVREACLLDQPSRRPPDFDLAAYWSRSSAEFRAALPRYPATLRVAPEALARLRRGGPYIAIERVGPPGDDGWSEVDLDSQVEDQACAFVLGFGAAVEVVAPPALRERVIALASGVIERYAGTAGAPRQSV